MFFIIPCHLEQSCFILACLMPSDGDISLAIYPPLPQIHAQLSISRKHSLKEILSLICRPGIWPYQPSLYVNLCTRDHDNSSCTYLDRATRLKIPRPVMACRSSWYSRDISVGSVIGYRPKEDIRSGLFVDLLHGDKCYRGGKGSILC